MSPDDARQPLLRLLRDYQNRHPVETEMVQRYIDFVEENSDCFERSLLIGHVTGSAFLLDSRCERVLLTHHAKLDRWLQPGGHADGESNVASVAMQEALEESGLIDIEFVTLELLDVDIHAIPARKDEPEHFHYDCRFLLKSSGDDQFVVSEESHDLAWAPLSDVSEYTDEASILRMQQKTQLVLNRP
ncbi:MAG: NUDIX hydrolase [Pseudomonadales bacterium]|nr:NUDIX hydrolase [Pseudomonadales bacterium]MBO6566372.1 NUDIX hydrolase [Pseudomonadales bacterium]MBO6597960.1 NUDIX hydrolase [Pseudomonadales bacterium]MBO6656962.1 NUDIX hydrolase [Pseudomonadales bacterium]MBO6823018.1 NUDIX hydrolase [Pseudomonadales bacterium]